MGSGGYNLVSLEVNESINESMNQLLDQDQDLGFPLGKGQGKKANTQALMGVALPATVVMVMPLLSGGKVAAAARRAVPPKAKDLNLSAAIERVK